MTIDQLQTPCLLLDKDRMLANVARMEAALAPHKVDLRPHLKTCKSPQVAQAMTRNWSGAITVSTLREAEEFFEAGYSDILYAVGIEATKLERAERLIRRGARLSLLVDSREAAEAVTAHSRRSGLAVEVFIEIDSDGHRAGIPSGDGDALVAIGRILASGNARLRGVLTHAGGSYGVATADELSAYAELERSSAVHAATLLREAGLPCPMVSIGSTPTALFSQDLTGVDEVRAGVFVFFDLAMAAIGVCSVEEIALSVLTRVIGHQKEKGWIIVDAGWAALSHDRGTARTADKAEYGVVCDRSSRPASDLVVRRANQEHGIVESRSGGLVEWERYPIGTLLRILPNHACATAAQHQKYQVVSDNRVEEAWDRFSGW